LLSDFGLSKAEIKKRETRKLRTERRRGSSNSVQSDY
jgi:hypothetical protein